METLAGWAYPKTLEIHPSQTLKYHTVFKLAELHGFLAVLRRPRRTQSDFRRGDGLVGLAEGSEQISMNSASEGKTGAPTGN